MRVLRKTMMLLGLALAAMALVASGASAQEEPVEVVHEPSGEACDPCVVHVEGETDIRRPDGILVSRCHDEFHIRIYHNGDGENEWVGASEGGPNCNAVNCAAPEDHWPIVDMGELDTGGEHFNMRFCSSGMHCDREVQVTSLDSHIYELATHERCPHPILPYVESEGRWETEHDLRNPADGEIEIIHDWLVK